jgi:hypothetical protein
VFAFAEKMTRADDHRALAQAMDLEPNELADAQQHLVAQHGRQSFIHFDRGEGTLQSWRPLPDNIRAGNIVSRTTVE